MKAIEVAKYYLSKDINGQLFNNNIVVKKSHRGHGIGGELLDALIELCVELNQKSLTLEVNVSNTPAINLYEKFGFQNLGIRKKYYNNTTDAIIMTKFDLL